MDLIVKQFDFSSPDKTFVYLSAAQCMADQWGIKDKPILTALSERRCPAYLKWEDARFLIEYKLGVHQTRSTTQQSTKSAATYVEGYLWVDGVSNWRKELTKIPHEYVMQPGDRVVVIRKPYKSTNNTPYVPLLFRSVHNIAEDDVKIEFTDTMTDDEKLQLLMEAQAERDSGERKRGNVFVEMHPSDMEGQGYSHKRQKPPADYVCHRCNIPGHFIQFCPTLSDPDFVPEYERRCPSGIPKKFLCEATTDEERKRAWITPEGKYVILTYNRAMI